MRRVATESSSCLTGLLMFLHACTCVGTSEQDGQEGQGVSIEWPWELGALTLLRRRSPEPTQPTPRVHAVSLKERKAKKLQDRVAAAIDSTLSESPTSDEPRATSRKGRNKCPSGQRAASGVHGEQSPTVVPILALQVETCCPIQWTNLPHPLQVPSTRNSRLCQSLPDLLNWVFRVTGVCKDPNQ